MVLLCSSALTCTLATEVLLFPGLGLFRNIRHRKGPGWQSSFPMLCFLYALSTVNFVADQVLFHTYKVSNNSICENIIFYQLCQTRVSTLSFLNFRIDLEPVLFRLCVNDSTPLRAVVVKSLSNVSQYV